MKFKVCHRMNTRMGVAPWAGVDLEQGKMVDCAHDLESLPRQTGKLSAVDWEVWRGRL